MKEFFTKIRNKEKDLSDEDSSQRTYEGEISPVTPWFLMGLSSKNTPVVPVPSSDIQKISEKIETLQSLQEFAEGRGEVMGDLLANNILSRKIAFPGGEVIIKESISTEYDFVVDEAAFTTLAEYLTHTKPCKGCMEAGIESLNSSPVFELLDAAGIEVLFVGDLPNVANESFSGESRQLLENMAKAMKLSANEYCFSTVVKCLDGPEKGHFEMMAANCMKNLLQEIFLLKPKAIVTLGALATNMLLGKKEKLSNTRGKVFTKNVKFADGQEYSFQVFPVFHPEFLLINPNMKRTAWTDLQKVMKYIGRL